MITALEREDGGGEHGEGGVRIAGCEGAGGVGVGE